MDFPKNFSKIIEYRDKKKLKEFFIDELTFDIYSKEDELYYPFGMIPEFFPIASMGVDGVTWGYINITPEIDQFEFPIAQLSPMDFDELYTICGKDTLESLKNIFAISYELIAYESDNPKKNLKIFKKIYKEFFDMKIDEDSAYELTKLEFNLKEVYKYPPNYTFIETSDSLGICVPNKFINKSNLKYPKDFKNKANILEAINKFNENEEYGNSLLLIRELFIDEFPFDDKTYQNQLLDKLKVIYKRLNRSELIEKFDECFTD